MTETNQTLVPASGDQMEIVDIGTVAAQNLALALNLAETHVPTIKKAIADEISLMSSHFSLAFRDVQDQYELDLAEKEKHFVEKWTATIRQAESRIEEIRSTFRFVEANVWKLIGVFAATFAVGAVIGHFA